MREILFRGKRIDNGEWVEGSLVIHPGNEVKIYTEEIHQGIKFLGIYEVDPSTVCQYTGLMDKNGNRMFDGDIIDISYFLTKNRAVVKFGKYKQSDMSSDYECGNQGFYVSVENNEHGTYRHDLYFYAHKCKVIGNIFDNQELLEVKTNETTL